MAIDMWAKRRLIKKPVLNKKAQTFNNDKALSLLVRDLLKERNYFRRRYFELQSLFKNERCHLVEIINSQRLEIARLRNGDVS